MAKIPKWVNTVLTNEFDDDPYWTEGVESDLPEAYRALTNIQQRPSDVNTFVESMEIYKTYIPEIEEYYGGKEQIEAYFEETGSYPPGYVLPPKLRMRKKNLQFAKNGFVPPKVGEYITPKSPEEIMDLAEKEFYDPENAREIIVDKPPKDHGLRKRIKKLSLECEGYKAKDIYGSNVNLAASYNLITQYWTNGESDNDDIINDTDIYSMTIDERAEAYDKAMALQNDEYQTVYEPARRPERYSGGRLIYTDEIKNITNWIKFLNDNGFDTAVQKSVKRLSPAQQKIIRNDLGISAKGKKELKQMQKRYKDYKKDIGKRSDSLRSISKSLSRRSSGIGTDIDDKIFDDIIRRYKK